MDSLETMNQFGALWADGFDQYVTTGDVNALTCALCTHQPCDCPPFGTPEYFTLVNTRHGKQG